MLNVDIDRDDEEDSPRDTRIREVIAATLKAADAGGGPREVSLRIVGEDEMRDLNGRYRGRNHPTNVLSFPADLPAGLGLTLLGDIALCGPVVRREAADQGKPAAAHWDHMIVHGTLHLLGHDHEVPAEAEAMEAIERRVLADLGWPDPYLEPAGADAVRHNSEADAHA